MGKYSQTEVLKPKAGKWEAREWVSPSQPTRGSRERRELPQRGESLPEANFGVSRRPQTPFLQP